MRLRLGTLSLSRRSGFSQRHLTMSGICVALQPSCFQQTAAGDSLRRIFVPPVNGVLHTALAPRQHNCLL